LSFHAIQDGANRLRRPVKTSGYQQKDGHKMDIRLAEATDAEELFQMNELFNGRGSTSIEALRKSLHENRQEAVFVAAINNKVVGFCCVQLFISMCYSQNYVELTELFVKEDYRNHGAATALLMYIEAYYKDANIGGYQLFTGKKNDIAQRFYEKNGYIKTDEIMYRKKL